MVNIKYKTKWEFPNFYNDINDKSISDDLNKLKILIDEFILKYKGKITSLNENDFLIYLEKDTEISILATKIGVFYSYLNSLNTQDQDIIKKQGEYQNEMIEISNKLIFVSQEFKEIGYEKLIEFSNSEILKDYKNYFFQKANSIKYLLDEKTEFALNLKENSGSSSFQNLYSELTNSFSFNIEIDREIKSLTDSEIRSLRLSPIEEIRKNALYSIREVYLDKKVQIVLGNTYSSILKDWTSEVKLRKYSSVMEIRNISEEMDNKTIDLLLTEIENAFPLYQKYLKIKAKNLGKDKLEIHNVLAPLSNIEKKYSFDESLEIFLDLMKNFDEEFYNYSKDMFEKGRVDVFPDKGKRGGAFAMYFKNYESYVLLNHTNKLTDVSTLAHELGHAIHGHLSQKQKEQVYESPLSLAETASVFNEMLLSEHIIKDLKDEDKKTYLDERLSDIFATIFRQIQYVLFEKRCHEKILNGEELSFEDFNKIWREEQIKMSGDMIIYDVEPEKEISWSTIPHIFRSPFYCYSYAFGNLLTFALYEKYKEEGKDFVENYKNILRAGGSKIPYELLKENGLDINDKEYYRKGLKVIEDMVSEYEEISNK